MATFRYLTAAQWGRTLTHAMQTEKLGDAEVYIHHTAGNPFSTLDAAEAFRRINQMEQSRGYACIGYDILVHHNTQTNVVTIGEGRGPWRSAATLDRNEEGEAICALGYFHPGHSLSAQPHPDMLEGIARGIVWGINQGWIAKGAVIRGHRDNPAHPGATACPGNYLYAHLGAIRNRVNQLLNPPKPTNPVEDDVNWNLPDSVRATVRSAPPTADVLAGKVNDWAVISLIKALQEFCGLPVTGRWDQRFGETINQRLGYKG